MIEFNSKVLPLDVGHKVTTDRLEIVHKLERVKSKVARRTNAINTCLS